MHSNCTMKLWRRLAFAAFLPVFCLVPGGAGIAAERNPPPPGEYQVKAAFVYNFIKFVTWPPGEDSHAGTVRLCVLGDVPDRAPFDGLEGLEIKGKRLHMVHLREPQDIRDCQVLFLSSTFSGHLPETLDFVQGRPILTVGDTENYAQRGVMINMYIDKKRVQFEINTDAADAVGLRISAKLLSLAGKVYGAARTGK